MICACAYADVRHAVERDANLRARVDLQRAVGSARMVLHAVDIYEIRATRNALPVRVNAYMHEYIYPFIYIYISVCLIYLYIHICMSRYLHINFAIFLYI